VVVFDASEALTAPVKVHSVYINSIEKLFTSTTLYYNLIYDIRNNNQQKFDELTIYKLACFFAASI
jgi:hypothetical protein